MTTQLTTPDVRVAVTTATLDAWSLDIVRNPDLTLDLTRTILTARVTLRNAAGQEVETKTMRKEVAALPAGLKTAGASFHATLITVLRAAGVLPAGTDTPDL